jgi:hypothetical protein
LNMYAAIVLLIFLYSRTAYIFSTYKAISSTWYTSFNNNGQFVETQVSPVYVS